MDKKDGEDEANEKNIKGTKMMMHMKVDLADHHDVLPELQHLRVALHHLIQLVYWQPFKWQTSLSSKPS